METGKMRLQASPILNKALRKNLKFLFLYAELTRKNVIYLHQSPTTLSLLNLIRVAF